jgi:hypothetical protein
MNELLAANLISLNIALFNVLPLSAESIYTETKECQNAIASVENQLQGGRQVTIELSEINKIIGYSDYPKGRPNEYNLSMSGNSVESILSSPVLMNTLATRIIDRCNSVSFVVFSLYQSGYVVSYGLINNKVEIFNCPEGYDPPYYRDLIWGESCAI